jgi:hypothetical protein
MGLNTDHGKGEDVVEDEILVKAEEVLKVKKIQTKRTNVIIENTKYIELDNHGPKFIKNIWYGNSLYGPDQISFPLIFNQNLDVNRLTNNKE